jgi:PIN domain nuclease of toxin-antitoxin system
LKEPAGKGAGPNVSAGNGYLLDTNIVLLGLIEPERISHAAKRAVERGPVFLSVVSYWEVLLKNMKGHLDVGDPRIWWAESLDKLAAAPLHLRPAHVSAVYTLEPIHQDPFDRVLIAQAIVEDLTFVTADDDIGKYSSKQFRVIS